MLSIKEQKNIYEQAMEYISAKNGKVYILGAGEGGTKLKDQLEKRGFEIDGFLVDKQYRTDGVCLGKPVYCWEDISNNSCEVIIFNAIRDYDIKRVEKVLNNVHIIDEDIFSLWTVDSNNCDIEYIKKNYSQFEKLADDLCDAKSIATLEAFLNQKISGKLTELKNVWEPESIFSQKFIDISRVGSFVDCGAYNGDSFLAFAREYEKQVGHEYVGNAFLLEPDSANYEQMVNNCKQYSTATFLTIGAWSEQDVLTFSSNGMASGLVEDGEGEIEVDSIDNIVNENRVDLIKMDIEGSELNALKGAKNTIIRDHPILCICVYHKREDLIVIPSYIKELYEEYKFYIRSYSNYTQELVLYAIP